MQLRHLRVLSYIPPDAAQLANVDGSHETILRIIADIRASVLRTIRGIRGVATLSDPVHLGGSFAAMAVSSAVQE
jgi:hypothetical protein